MVSCSLTSCTYHFLIFYDAEDLTIPFSKDDNHPIQIYGYCNGIVCVKIGNNVVLCNPAIGEFRKLPDSCLFLPSPEGKFQLETSFGGLGFGYDCKAKEYKIVQIIETCEYSDDEQTYYHCIALPHSAEVYITTANSWKEIKIDISSKTYSCSCPVYLKGFCYWFASHHNEYILSFDVGDELFQRIQLPSRRESGFKFHGLFMYNESITSYCTCYDPSEDSKFSEISVMGDYNGVKSSNTKLLTIGPFKGIEYPLTLSKCDELLMLASGGRAASYNSSTRNLKYFYIPPIINEVIDFKALIYVESIVPVK